MGSEPIAPAILSPLGLLAQIGFVAFATWVLRETSKETFEQFGLKRITLGYVASVGAILLLAVIDAFLVVHWKIGEKTLRPEMLKVVLPKWILTTFAYYLFCLVVLLSAIGVPLLFRLYKRKQATVLNAALTGIFVAFVFHAAVLMLVTVNSYHKAHFIVYYFSTLSEVGVRFLCVSVAFSIGARLPLYRQHTL